MKAPLVKSLAAVFLLLLVGGQTAVADKVFSVEVVGRLPHDRKDFTQGLEIRDGKLYQGTGLRGRSALQVFDLDSGRKLREVPLPDQYFGEGITVLGDEIFQLTWRAGVVRVYERDSLALKREFEIPGEGWGLTNDGKRLIYSDGSHRLHLLTPEGDPLGTLEVLYRNRPVTRLNELEWTPDHLLANIWGRDWIFMIDIDRGDVIGRIDLTGLLPRRERRPDTDVLNGIAVNHATGALWVTGKNWPWIYQIELQERKR